LGHLNLKDHRRVTAAVIWAPSSSKQMLKTFEFGKDKAAYNLKSLELTGS